MGAYLRADHKEVEGRNREPYEQLAVDVPLVFQGAVMQRLGERKGDLLDMRPNGVDRVRLDYRIAARQLAGSEPSETS